MNTNIEILKNALLEHSRYLLNESEMFYPFGMIIDLYDDVVPYNVFWGEEYPSGEEIVKELTNLLLSELQEERVKAIGIAIDTSFTQNEKIVNAIEIRVLEENGNSFNSYLRYRKDETLRFDKEFTNEPWI